MTTSEISHLLFEDEAGALIGLEEVQLLEPVPIHRIPALRQLLYSADLYVAYCAARVLAAWADGEGLGRIEAFLEMPIHGR